MTNNFGIAYATTTCLKVVTKIVIINTSYIFIACSSSVVSLRFTKSAMIINFRNPELGMFRLLTF